MVRSSAHDARFFSIIERTDNKGVRMLNVYGIKASRAIRVMWLCRELGLDFEHVKVNFADPSTKSPEFLAINPGGKVPAIDDDGFGMYESMAIYFYLAKKHGSSLVPKDLKS